MRTGYSASFSPDGRRIVTASDDKTARVWDAESGKPVGEPLRHEDAVSAQVSVRTGGGSSPLWRQDRAGMGRGERQALASHAP